MPDWDSIDLSFDGQVAAAMAVVTRWFRLFGASQGDHFAAAIAARHPERVEALVL